MVIAAARMRLKRSSMAKAGASLPPPAGPHAEGIFLAERLFGHAIVNRDGRVIPVRHIGEQHVREDLGRIPSFQDWISEMATPRWMYGQRMLIHREVWIGSL